MYQKYFVFLLIIGLSTALDFRSEAPKKICGKENKFYDHTSLQCITDDACFKKFNHHPKYDQHTCATVEEIKPDCISKGEVLQPTRFRGEPAGEVGKCQKQCSPEYMALEGECELCQAIQTASGTCHSYAVILHGSYLGTSIQLFQFTDSLKTLLAIERHHEISLPVERRADHIPPIADISELSSRLSTVISRMTYDENIPTFDLYAFFDAPQSHTPTQKSAFEKRIHRALSKEMTKVVDESRIYTWVIDGRDEAKFLYYGLNAWLGLLGSPSAADVLSIDSRSIQTMQATEADFPDLWHLESIFSPSQHFYLNAEDHLGYEDLQKFYNESVNYVVMETPCKLESSDSAVEHCRSFIRTFLGRNVQDKEMRPSNPRNRLMYIVGKARKMVEQFKNYYPLQVAPRQNRSWKVADSEDLTRMAHSICQSASLERLKDEYPQISENELKFSCLYMMYLAMLVEESYGLDVGTKPWERHPVSLRFDLDENTLNWIHGALLWAKWEISQHDTIISAYLKFPDQALLLDDNLVCLLDASNVEKDDSLVWEDITTHGHDAKAHSKAKMPRLIKEDFNNRVFKAFRFDGIDDGFSIDPHLELNDQYTIFIVNRFWDSKAGRTLQSTQVDWSLGLRDSDVAHYAGGYLGSEVAEVGRWYISTAVRDDKGFHYFLDGELKGDSKTGMSPGRLALVGDGYASNSASSSDVAEVIIYNSAIGANQRSRIEQHLGNKFGINVTTK